MALVETVEKIIQDELDRVSHEILVEMTTVVSKHSRSGKAVSALHIEDQGEFAKFVGGTDGSGTGQMGTDHLAMLNDGNGSGGIPKNPPPRRPMPMTYGYPGRNPIGGFAMRASNYAGIHFVETIAAKHGGG